MSGISSVGASASLSVGGPAASPATGHGDTGLAKRTNASAADTTNTVANANGSTTTTVTDATGAVVSVTTTAPVGGSSGGSSSVSGLVDVTA